MKLWKDTSEELNGFLDHGISLTGELFFSGTLRIDGEVHGSIQTSDVLVVGERASIHADVKAGEVRIYGSIFGNIECSRRVEIFASGQLRGDVHSPQLVIAEGGVFEGRSRGTADPSPPPTAVPVPVSRDETPLPPIKAKSGVNWPEDFPR